MLQEYTARELGNDTKERKHKTNIDPLCEKSALAEASK